IPRMASDGGAQRTLPARKKSRIIAPLAPALRLVGRDRMSATLFVGLEQLVRLEQTMTPTQFNRLQTHFTQLCDLPRKQQTERLAEIGRRHPDLKRELSELLLEDQHPLDIERAFRRWRRDYLQKHPPCR